MDLCAILQFNGDCFMAQFHQKPVGLQSKTKTEASQQTDLTAVTLQASWWIVKSTTFIESSLFYHIFVGNLIAKLYLV